MHHKVRRTIDAAEVLPIIGLGIVLITFIVKDGIREDLKDFADAMDNATGVFAIQGDSDNLASQLRVIEEQVGRVEQATRLATKDPFTILATNQLMMSFHRSLDRVERSIENMSRLSQRFPEQRQKGLDKELTGLRNQAADARRELREEAVIVARAAPQSAAFGGAVAASDRQAILNANVSVGNNVGMLSLNTQKLSINMLKEAEAIQANKEKRYNECTVVSYVFYGIGWLLALIARLLGFEGTGV